MAQQAEYRLKSRDESSGYYVELSKAEWESEEEVRSQSSDKPSLIYIQSSQRSDSHFWPKLIQSSCRHLSPAAVINSQLLASRWDIAFSGDTSRFTTGIVYYFTEATTATSLGYFSQIIEQIPALVNRKRRYFSPRAVYLIPLVDCLFRAKNLILICLRVKTRSTFSPALLPHYLYFSCLQS